MVVPFVEAALVGAAVGLLVGMTSMGAGALLTPALVLLLGVPPRIAVGSDVLIAGVMKLFGGGAYAIRLCVLNHTTRAQDVEWVLDWFARRRSPRA